jgi:DNA repair protein RecN (Recombination protein N)
MIAFLRIQNLATIEDIRLDFSKGFSILTGETGAGKSIIIDSIRLICGEKAVSDLVRTGRSEASVEAIFSIPGQEKTEGLSSLAEEDNSLTAQRWISEDGSGKAYCNGILVPLKKLREITGNLVDIYGQNDHIFLLQLESHLDYLDHFSGTTSLREETARSAQDLRRLLRTRDEWKTRERERALRCEFLEYQIKEIEKANLKPCEEEELRAQRNVLKNAEKISALVARALDISYAGEASLASQMAMLETILAELATFLPAFSEMKESFSPLDIVVHELSDLLMKYSEKQDLTPEKLEKIEERLSLIEGLKRKYGGDIRDIQTTLDHIKREHKELSEIQEKLAVVEADIEKTFASYSAQSLALSEARKKAAPDLEKLIEKEIALLGMKKARFRIQIDSSPQTVLDAGHAKDTGIDNVEFLISPNPGEELRPLRKIASGGELSRIMLALRAVGKDKEEFRTFIFDEIDSGIGGKTAEFIAQKLKRLAKTHQVICITHLPQIASFATHHYRIDKKIEKERTFTTVKKLAFEERIEEIARLMTGSRITGVSLESARDMLRHNLQDDK